MVSGVDVAGIGIITYYALAIYVLFLIGFGLTLRKWLSAGPPPSVDQDEDRREINPDRQTNRPSTAKYEHIPERSKVSEEFEQHSESRSQSELDTQDSHRATGLRRRVVKSNADQSDIDSTNMGVTESREAGVRSSSSYNSRYEDVSPIRTVKSESSFTPYDNRNDDVTPIKEPRGQSFSEEIVIQHVSGRKKRILSQEVVDQVEYITVEEEVEHYPPDSKENYILYLKKDNVDHTLTNGNCNSSNESGQLGSSEKLGVVCNEKSASKIIDKTNGLVADEDNVFETRETPQSADDNRTNRISSAKLEELLADTEQFLESEDDIESSLSTADDVIDEERDSELQNESNIEPQNGVINEPQNEPPSEVDAIDGMSQVVRREKKGRSKLKADRPLSMFAEGMLSDLLDDDLLDDELLDDFDDMKNGPDDAAKRKRMQSIDSFGSDVSQVVMRRASSSIGGLRKTSRAGPGKGRRMFFLSHSPALVR